MYLLETVLGCFFLTKKTGLDTFYPVNVVLLSLLLIACFMHTRLNDFQCKGRQKSGDFLLSVKNLVCSFRERERECLPVVWCRRQSTAGCPKTDGADIARNDTVFLLCRSCYRKEVSANQLLENRDKWNVQER